MSRLYRDGREIGPFLDPEERGLLASAAPGTPPYSYQVWFDYRTLHDPAGGGFIGYDLSRKPKDLCIDIKGTPYMNVGTGLVTNTIVIPKQVISAALAKY